MRSRNFKRSEDTSLQGVRRRRPVKLALGGLLVIAAPLAFANPASAAYDEDSKTVALTFVTFGGATLTCRLEGFGSHDTSQPAYVFGKSTTTDTNGSPSDSCDAAHTLTFRYRDGNEDETFVAGASDTNQASFQLFEGDVSNITIEHSVSFVACNQRASATCTLATTTAPK